MKYVKKINGLIKTPPKTYVDENSVTFTNYNKNYTKLETDGWIKTEKQLGTFDIIDNEIVDIQSIEILETKKYSKYKLKLELQKVGLWNSIKTLLTADTDLWENFMFANELSEEDEFFNTFISSIRNNPEFSSYIDQVLNNAKI